MDATQIGLRLQDFHESLQGCQASAPKEMYFQNTLLLGKVATLAMHLRGLDHINDANQITIAAAALGITSIELPTVLRELEEIDFVSVTWNGNKVGKVLVKVPVYSPAYTRIGERWKDSSPSEIERAGVSTLGLLHNGPIQEADLREQITLEKSPFGIMTTVMEAGHLIGTELIDGQGVVYSPLAIDGNPEVYLKWATQHKDNISSLLQSLKLHQGLAASHPLLQGNQALIAAARTGVLMPVEIKGATGSQRFFFAPYGGLNVGERTILDKARAIVSCVRYGENFAAGRKILYPASVLQTLRDRKRFKTAHPDLLTQYGILVEKMIGVPVEEGYGYNVEIVDTPENLRAFDVAIEMVQFGESTTVKIDNDAQEALLTTHGYSGPLTVRPGLAKPIPTTAETQADIIKKLVNMTRGGWNS